MAEKSKVIRGLERCAGTDCTRCPYQGISPCQNKLAADAFALLKEQEPRVLTKKDVECDCPDCVYFETRTGWLECSVKDEGESDHYFGVFVYGCNEWFMRSYEEYGKTWRCWTSRPSEQQMRETPWEGEYDG